MNATTQVSKVYDVSKEFTPIATHILHGGEPSLQHPRPRRGKTRRKNRT